MSEGLVFIIGAVIGWIIGYLCRSKDKSEKKVKELSEDKELNPT